MDPALRFFLILNAFPQGVVWGILVGILVVLSLGRVRRLPKNRAIPRRQKVRVPSPARDLVGLLRRSRYSPWARRALRHRLARLAVTLRTERELISPDQGWQELWSGRWPEEGALARVLRGEESSDFLSSLAAALEELSSYTQGGDR